MTEFVRALISEITSDPEAVSELAAALEPYAPAVQEDRWMDTREAAAYLGFGSPGPLKKLTAARTVPFHQDTPGGKCWFLRSELDRWRRGGDVRSLRRVA